MRRSAGFTRWQIVGAVAIIALVLSVVLASRRENRSVKLPDGSVLTLVGVGQGGKPFTTAKPWHRLARKWLPVRLQVWIPKSNSIRTGMSNEVIVFFRRLDTNTGIYVDNARSRSGLAHLGCQAADDSGFTYDFSNEIFTMSAGREVIFGFTLKVFPRRQPEFQAVVVAHSTQEVARFTVENPFPARHPVWTPEPLPVTKTNGPVALTLRGYPNRKRDRKDRLPDPQWNVIALEPAWKGTLVAATTYEDATGNTGSRLSPLESAWRIRAVVRRPESAHFGAHETFTLTNLVLPERGTLRQLNETAVVAGTRLAVLLLASPGKICVTNDGTASIEPLAGPPKFGWLSGSLLDGRRRARWDSDDYSLLLASDLDPADSTLIGLVRDAFGEFPRTTGPSLVADWPFRAGTPPRLFLVRFRPPFGTRAVSLDVIVNRGREFSFLVAPSAVLGTNGPAESKVERGRRE